MNTYGAAICAGIGILQLLCATVAFADNKDAELQVITQERRYTEGILHGDIRVLDSVWADTFVDTNGNAILRDKATMLALIGRNPHPTRIVESHRLVSLYGSTAVVTVEFQIFSREAGKSRMTAGRATDVWVRQRGQWRCVAAHSSEAPDEDQRVPRNQPAAGHHAPVGAHRRPRAAQ